MAKSVAFLLRATESVGPPSIAASAEIDTGACKVCSGGNLNVWETNRMVSGPILPLIVTSAEFIACEVSEITAEATNEESKTEAWTLFIVIVLMDRPFINMLFFSMWIFPRTENSPHLSVSPLNLISTPSGSKAIRAYILRTTATA